MTAKIVDEYPPQGSRFEGQTKLFCVLHSRLATNLETNLETKSRAPLLFIVFREVIFNSLKITKSHFISTFFENHQMPHTRKYGHGICLGPTMYHHAVYLIGG